jgi:hypothetical protein
MSLPLDNILDGGNDTSYSDLFATPIPIPVRVWENESQVQNVEQCNDYVLLVDKETSKKNDDLAFQNKGKLKSELQKKRKELMGILDLLSEDKQIEFFDFAKKFVEEAREQDRFEKIAGEYKPFPVSEKITAKSITDHLKEQFKDHLKYFGKVSEDSIYLDELRKIEPLTQKMYDKLYYEHTKNHEVPNLQMIISKKSVRVTKELEEYGADSAQRLRRIASAKAWREENNFQTEETVI